VGTKGRRRVTAQTRRIVPTPSRVPFVPRCCQCSSSNDSRRVLFRFIQRGVATRLRVPPCPFPVSRSSLRRRFLRARETRRENSPFARQSRYRCASATSLCAALFIARMHARRTRARNASAYARRSHTLAYASA